MQVGEPQRARRRAEGAERGSERENNGEGSVGVQTPGVEEARWPGVCTGDAGAGPRAQSVASAGLEASGLGEGPCKQHGEREELWDGGPGPVERGSGEMSSRDPGGTPPTAAH